MFFRSKLELDLVPRLDGDIVDANRLSIVELYNVVSIDQMGTSIRNYNTVVDLAFKGSILVTTWTITV